MRQGWGSRCPLPAGARLTDGLRGRDGARRQRAAPRALHLPVQLPVPQVVHGAARAAQQHRAQPKQAQQARVRGGARGGGQADGPEAGPGEQPGADGLVQPHELRVGHPGRRQAVQPGACRRRLPAGGWHGCRCGCRRLRVVVAAASAAPARFGGAFTHTVAGLLSRSLVFGKEAG
jgi:hypothetical protein